jgi:hypothetical protein
MAELPRDDGAHLRISDAERHAVAEILRDAAAQGRLTLEELEERLEQSYAARTYGDLVPLTADLPDARPPRPAGSSVSPRPQGRPAPRPTPAGPLPTRTSSVAVMSNVERRGSWRAEGDHTAFSFWGSVVIDLRQATWPDGLVINAWAIMASVEVIVDPWTVVDVDGIGFMGDFSQSRDKVQAEIGPDSPRVRVRGLALMGSVNVKRRGTEERTLGQRIRDQLPPFSGA